VLQFIGGLRAGMGCGSKDIPTLQETGRFVRITASGINESHPHNVTITKESPILKIITSRVEYKSCLSITLDSFFFFHNNATILYYL
jgi:hypothetical protein